MESPTIRTRSGSAAVGSLGLGGAVVGVDRLVRLFPGAGPDPWCDPPTGAAGRGPDRREPHAAPDRPFDRPVIETMCESCRARLSAATGPGHVEADRAPRADGRDLGVVLQGGREQAGTRGRRRRRRAPGRAATVPARGRPRAGPARRADATATGRVTPSPRGGAVCGRWSSEAVVDEGRDADRTEGGDAEQCEAEQPDLHRGLLAGEGRLQTGHAQRGHELGGDGAEHRDARATA